MSVVMSRRAFVITLVLVGTQALVGCEWIGATNPLDPAAGDAIRAKATISGRVSVVDGRSPQGAVVEVLRAGKVIATADVRVERDDDASGTYSLEVPSDLLSVQARLPGFLAGPIDLRAGPADVVNLDLTLNPEAPSASVAGQLTGPADLPLVGAVVALVDVIGDDDDCQRPSTTTASADAAGAYRFPAVRPGRYRIFVSQAGALTNLSAPFDVDADADVNAPALALQDADNAVVLEVDGTSVIATAADAVDVVLTPQTGLDTMRLGFDAGFDPGQGATGVLPFQSTTSLALPGGDVVEGDATVFVRLAGACGESPLYSVPLVADRTPAVLLAASLDGTPLNDGAVATTVVLRDTAASARLQIAGLDQSGIARIVLRGDVEDERTVVPTRGQFAATVDIAIPAAEGRYQFSLALVDAAGNETPVTEQRDVVVVRDLLPPRSPIPAATVVETFGPRAMIWLEAQADCPPGSEPFACEAVDDDSNVPPLFELQGGNFTDFTPVAGPPFVVEVPADRTTRFLIRAKDAAGNLSGANAAVDVVQTTTRSRFTVDVDREFGLPVRGAEPPNQIRAGLDDPAPPLAVAGGNAFFSVRPLPGRSREAAFSMLVAQPADLSSVGLRPSQSNLARSIRRLSYARISGGPHIRLAGGLGADDSRLHWLESTLDDGAGDIPFSWMLGLDADGRFDVGGTDRLFPNGVDDEGEATVSFIGGKPRNIACTIAGPAPCGRDEFSWRSAATAPPGAASLHGRQVAVPGLSISPVGFGGDDAGVVDVPDGGVRFVGAAFQQRSGGSRLLNVLRLRLNVPPGTPLRPVVFAESGSPLLLRPADGAAFVDDGRVFLAAGTGEELISLSFDPLQQVGSNERFFIGVFIEADVPVSLPTVGVDSVVPVDGFVGTPLGTAIFTRPTLGDFASLPRDVDVDEDVFPVMTLLVPASATAGAPVVAGLVVTDLGSNDYPDGLSAPASAVAVHGAGIIDRAIAMPLAAPGVDAVLSASNASIVTPAANQACAVVVRAERDTPLEDITIDGAGLLDDLRVRFFKTTEGRAIGVYESDPEFSILFPPNNANCEDQVATSRIDESVDVIIPAVEVFSDVEEEVIIEGLNESTTPFDVPNSGDGEEIVVVLPVVPGTVLDLATVSDPGSPGDADLFFEFDSGQTGFRGNDGDERTLTTVPPDATTITISVVAFLDDVFGNLVVSQLPEEIDIGSFAVDQRGDRMRVIIDSEFFGSELEVLGRFDGTPDDVTFDCRDLSDTPVVCTVDVRPGATNLVVVARPSPRSFFAGDPLFINAVVDSGFETVELSRDAVVTGDSTVFDFDGNPAGGPQMVVQLLNANGDVRRTCRASAPNPQRCSELIPADVVEVVVSATPNDVDAAFTYSRQIFTPGCSSVRIGRGSGAQVFRKGEIYAVVVGLGAATWPPTNPSIAVGSPVENDNPDITVLGSTLSPRVVQTNKLALTSLDATRCRVAIGVQSRAVVSQPAVGGRRAAAVVVEGGEARIVVADLDAEAPALDDLVVIPEGDRILALGVDDAETLRIVQSVEGASVVVTARSADVGVDDSCEILRTDFLGASAAISPDGGSLVLGGVGPSGPAVLVYDLDEDPCAPARRRFEQLTPTTPLAVARDGDDVFLIHRPEGTGGELLHVDLREPILLIPAGSREVVGAAPLLGDDVIVALAPRLGGTGQLVRMDRRRGTVRVLTDGPIPFQPTVVRTPSGDVVASVDINPNRGALPAFVVRSLADDGETVAFLPGSVAGAPGFDPINARRFAREAVFAADGDRLALVDFSANGNRVLRVLTLDGLQVVDSAIFTGQLRGSVRSLQLSGDVVVVSDDTGLRALRIDTDANTLTPIAIAANEAIVGAVDGSLLLATDPGDLFADRPPQELVLRRRAPDSAISGEDDVDLGERMPAATFRRVFTSIIDEGDNGILILDNEAVPSVGWRLRSGGRAQPDDGALRPLADQARLGRSAQSSGLVIHQTATGAALLDVR